MPATDDKCGYCGHVYGVHFMEPQGVACPDQPGKKAVPAGSRGWFKQIVWVKCIDNSDRGGGRPALTVNKVYKVQREGASSFYLQNDKGVVLDYIKGRFVAASDPNVGASAAPVQAARAPATKEVDVSDWRAWSNKQPGQCACGIARQQCDYHKDARS